MGAFPEPMLHHPLEQGWGSSWKPQELLKPYRRLFLWAVASHYRFIRLGRQRAAGHLHNCSPGFKACASRKQALPGSWGMGRLARVNTGVQCSQGRSGAGTFLAYTPGRGHTGTFTRLKSKSFWASQVPQKELPGVLF